MKRKWINNIFVLTILIFAFGCATSGKGKETGMQNPVVTSIDVIENQLNIVVDKPFTYTIYKSSDPYKVIVELPDVRMGFTANKITSNKAGITEVTPSQTEDPLSTKLEILLSSPVNVEPVYKDNTLAVKVKEEPAIAEVPKASEAQVPAEKSEPPVISKPVIPTAVVKDEAPVQAKVESVPAPVVTTTQKDLPAATTIVKVIIEKGDDAVKVIIKGNGSLNPNVFRLDNRAVLDMPNVAMASSVPAAVAPIKNIRAGKHKDKTRLVIDMNEGTSFDVAAVEDSVIIVFKNAGTEKTEAKVIEKAAPTETKTAALLSQESSEGKYKGQKISLDFQDADIGPIFRLLADISGYNFVIDPAVKGKVTMKLMNVPWDHALDIILQTFSLGKSMDGNIIWIAPTATFTKIAEDKKKSKDVEDAAEELTQEIVRINYATASDINTAISAGKLLSARGSITTDTRMNTLIIKDIQKSINKIKDLVKIMDVSKPQVMIEAKIVQVSSDYNQTLGIRWGATFEGAPGRTFGTSNNPTSGSILFGGDQTGDGGIRGLGNEVIGGLSVNTPTSALTGPGGVLSFLIGSANSTQVALSLQALETLNKAKTLSNPKILTLDNESAIIQQGRTFFISTVSQAGTQTQQQTATLMLNVTPKITPDGYVQLTLNVTDNSLVSVEPPVVDTKSLTTKALVKNGETLVLGGIYTTSTTEGETGIPILSKIPILGWLFKTKTQTGPNVKEMLVFITPTVVGKQ